MTESLLIIQALRQRLAAIESGPATPVPRASTGHAGIDRALGGGLARGRLHELFAADADAASGAGFAAMLATRLAGDVIWLREDQAERRGGGLFASGLIEIGLDPNRLIMGLLPDPLAVLRTAFDVARCPQLGVAVIELWGNPRLMDLTASRRLALAAEASGVTLLMVRVAAKPLSSAAQTRWTVRSLPSRPLQPAAPGHPALELELLRQRGGRAGEIWRLEWNRDEASFQDRDEGGQALSGAVVSLPGDRSADEGDVLAWRRAG